jgi:hypothetical protein
MAGYRVLEAANLDEAIRSLEQHPVDVVVAALDLPPNGSSALLAAMRADRSGTDPDPGAGDSAEQLGREPARRRFPGLPGEVRPGGHARIGGAAGLGAGFRGGSGVRGEER